MEWSIGYWQISIQRVYPTNEQLSRMYNAAAPGWNRLVHHLGIRHAYTKLFRSLQKDKLLASIKDNATVCDCGIGTAAFSLALSNTVNCKLQISGVDISPEMLEKAQQHLRQSGIEPKLHQSDVNTLPFHDNKFDLMISAHMLEHLPNPVKGLQEMVRVLRLGAPLILAVTHPGLLGWWIEWHWGNGCFSPNELTAMMTEAGLTDIHVYSFTAGLARWTSTAYVGVKRSISD